MTITEVTAVKAVWVRTQFGVNYLRLGSDDWFELTPESYEQLRRVPGIEADYQAYEKAHAASHA